jgi:DNA-binding MarR family transcriptional regulator
MTIEEEIKQTKFRNGRQKASLNILYTANWLQSLHNDFFRSFGITNQQFNILRILRGQHPQTISGTAIRSRMLDQNSDVSRLVDRLVSKSLVVKNPSPCDKRSADILILDKGLQLLAKIDEKIEFLDGLLNALTPEEALQLSAMLDKSRG